VLVGPLILEWEKPMGCGGRVSGWEGGVYGRAWRRLNTASRGSGELSDWLGDHVDSIISGYLIQIFVAHLGRCGGMNGVVFLERRIGFAIVGSLGGGG